MRTPRFRTLALCGCLAAVCCAVNALAAPPVSPRAGTGEDAPAAVAEDAIKEAQPPVLYLRGKDGGLLQAVLGFTLEDFERLRAQQNRDTLGVQPPRMIYDRLICRGKPAAGHADLTIELTATVSVPGWVRLPLRMSTAVLRGTPGYEGPGEHVVEYDAATREYVCWLRGASDKPHVITLEIAVPLEKLAEQTELKLDFPRAATSELTLTVPETNATARLRAGGVLDRTKKLKAGTEFHVLGLDRDFSIAWRHKPSDAADAPLPLDASGAIEARIDGAAVHSVVTLSLRGFSPRLDSFRMRVPTGATLSAEEHPEYAIEPIEEAPEGEAPKGALYLVRLREAVTGPLVIRFTLDRPHVPGEGSRTFEVAGVEVLGAMRPWGHVAVVAEDDWQISFDELRNARQIDDLPPDLNSRGVIAGFEYDGQPFAIAGRIAPRRSHVSVTPTYQVDVDAGQARLQARLKYLVRGAKAFALDCDLSGWELDDVTPRSVFDVDRVAVEPGKPLRVPLLQPGTGEFELVLRAHRDLAANAGRVEFLLPRPTADSVAPAQVTITPAPNVALNMREGALSGLSRVTASAGAAADHPRQILLRASGPESRFSADLHVQSQTVAAEVASRVTLNERGGNVDETILYRIANEPLGELVLNVPAWLADSDSLQFEVDGAAISPLWVGGDQNDEPVVQLRLPLGDRREGQCRMTVQYAFDADPIAPGSASLTTVPLVMPVGADVIKNDLLVARTAGMIVEPHGDVWAVEPVPPAEVDRAALRLSAASVAPEAALEVRLEDRHTFDPAVVERVWIQSRLAGGERQDRAVFLFSGGDSRVSLRLPPGANEAEARAVLDGVPLAPRASSQRDVLSFDLSPTRRRHVLDVSYRFTTRSDEQGGLQLVAPVLGDNLWVRQTYWQLVLPSDQHLVAWPADLSAAFAWRLRGLGWGRQPLVEQPQLEAWVDAAHGIELPEHSNRYVFTALGSIPELDVYTARRSTLVFAAAGAALALGLSLLYVPALRRPRLLFVPGVLLVAAAFLYPEPTVLLLQFALLGVALFGVALVLERFVGVRRRPLVIRSGPSAIQDLGSTRTHQAGPKSPSGGAPALIPQASVAEGDS